MHPSLPARFSLTTAALVVGTLLFAVSLSHRIAVDTLEAQGDRAAAGLLEALAVSHAGELLAQRPEDVVEMRRSAQRLTETEAGGVVAVTFYDGQGQPVAESQAAGVAPSGPVSLPEERLGETPAPGLRRWIGPVRFGGRRIGAIAVVVRDDLALHLRPRLAYAHLGLALASALLCAAVVFGLARRYLSAVPALAMAIDRVREADFTTRVPEHGNHELSRLALAFNEMSRRLELFSQYTNPAVIRALIQDPDLAGPGGVSRHVTVVFCDMRGFTRMSAQRAPTAVLRQVNLYFQLLERVVLDHGGHIDKFMGDAIMAVFGLFETSPADLPRRLAENGAIDYSANAVRAMLRARDAVRVLNAFLAEAANDPRFPAELSPQVFGCGIASGHVTAGNLGGLKKKDYSVVGSIVNLAARLESQSRQGEVLVDGHTWRNLGGAGVVRPRPPVELKGLERPVTPYEVLRFEADEVVDREAFRTYARALFDRAFVHQAVWQGDPLAGSADLEAWTSLLRAQVERWEPVTAPAGPGTDGTG